MLQSSTIALRLSVRILRSSSSGQSLSTMAIPVNSGRTEDGGGAGDYQHSLLCQGAHAMEGILPRLFLIIVVIISACVASSFRLITTHSTIPLAIPFMRSGVTTPTRSVGSCVGAAGAMRRRPRSVGDALTGAVR